MLIKEEAFRHWINHFYGFGSWEAKIWFITHEEGGGDVPEEVAEKLNYFQRVHAEAKEPQLCDIRALYREVEFRVQGPRKEKFETLFEYRFEKGSTLHGLWKNLIAFTFGYKGKKLPDLLRYQRELFLSPDGASENLITLYPLPSPHNHAWYYAWLDIPGFDFIKTRPSYQEHLYQQRITAILTNVKKFKPKLVLMYGMENINALKRTIQDFFPHTKFKVVKAIPRQIPQHHRSDAGQTTFIITTQVPALRHNRIETGFEWEEFGKQIREGVQ